MRKLKQLITNTKVLLAAPGNAVAAYYRKNRALLGSLTNIATILAFTIGVVALLALIWLYVRPIHTANIKVPVATDQSSYYPGEDISGIFFGDTYYNGEVRILREVFCKDYKAVIRPPEFNGIGDLYSTQAKPSHLEGRSVTIGNLPSDIPVGLNCVLQFTNIYEVQTPFGLRRIEYQYYTQNFAIVTKERRQQLECEASGRKDCNFIVDIPKDSTSATTEPQAVQSSPETPEASQQPTTTNNTTNNSTVNNPPAQSEPAPQFHEVCTINFLGIKVNCHQEPVN